MATPQSNGQTLFFNNSFFIQSLLFRWIIYTMCTIPYKERQGETAVRQMADVLVGLIMLFMCCVVKNNCTILCLLVSFSWKSACGSLKALALMLGILSWESKVLTG